MVSKLGGQSGNLPFNVRVEGIAVVLVDVNGANVASTSGSPSNKMRAGV